MKISTITMAFATIMLHVLLLLAAYTLQENRTLAASVTSNFLGASTYNYENAVSHNADESRTVKVLIPNKYR